MISAASGPRRDGTGGGPVSEGFPATGRALIRVLPEPARPRFFGLRMSHGAVAAAVALVMGTGFVAGTELFADKPGRAVMAQAGPPPETQMDVLYRVQTEVRSLKASLDGLRSTAEKGRQEDTIRGLKKSVDVLKQDLEGAKAASSAAVGQLSAKIDKIDRDPGPKLAEISARLDKLDRDPGPKLAEISARLDKMDRDPGAKLGEIASRVDRIERQVSSGVPTGSLPPQASAPSKTPMPPQRAAQALPSTSMASGAAGSAQRSDTTGKGDPLVKPEAPIRQEAAAKPTTIEGWMLRDVYGGVALLEGRAGGLREVAPGEYIPGVGEIRSIERRGRSWVVVTSRGIIQADNRW